MIHQNTKKLDNNHRILEFAKKTLELEGQSVLQLINYLDDNFSKAVDLIYHSKGRVIVTGVGKSAIIANKIVATLNSTGTPAIFMHAADAIHGDLGLVQDDDIVLCISKSGDTPEIKVLIPFIKSNHNTLIGMTGNPKSFLGTQSDFVLRTTVEKEACPNDLAPTTSTTAQLAMGDAVAVSLLQLRSFTSTDFAKYHPGGALGKKLYLRVGDLSSQNEVPAVSPQTKLKDIILEITNKRLGLTAVLDGNDLQGIITDGDLRRMLHNNPDLNQVMAVDIMTKNPKTIAESEMAFAAKDLMENFGISQLIVVNEKGIYCGVLHMHDLIREGLI